ncbi:MAG: SRPBCC family protein [Pyrinomonadaceae bacterium]|nr:SRPBCC family protein [Pyrinomonadaceae bacterium]MCX7640568.1 SRPBCC family protein [Pyrinomonadaceae bacterium]MDW8303851.1 SRPBCC family protein [Acidobacteriota bacterium]
MELKIQNEFEVSIDFKTAWSFFSNPEMIVPCIPGAEITRTNDDGSFDGIVRVKLGAVSLNFTGTMRYESLNESARIMTLTGEGKEKGGAGRAKAIIESAFSEDNGKTKVSVTTTVNLSGKILQYGRGMFEQIAKQHFNQFAECARNCLEGTEKKTPPKPAKLNPFSLIFKAFIAWIVGFVKSIFGKKSDQSKAS